MFQAKNNFSGSRYCYFKYHETVKHQINSDYKIISETDIAEKDNSVKNIKIQPRISQRIFRQGKSNVVLHSPR